MQDVARAAVPFPDNHDHRVSRRRPVAGPLRAADHAGTARPSTCSTATPRPSRSSPSSMSRSRCRSPTRRRWKTCSSTSSSATQGPNDSRHPDLRRPGRPAGGREDDDLAGHARPRGRAPEDDPAAAAQAARPDLHGQGRPADDHLRGRPKTSRPRSASTRWPTSPSSPSR